MASFRTKTSDRWSDRLTPAGILDMALRGSEEQWWELYHAVSSDAALRELLSRLLETSDPDLRGGRRLWEALLKRMGTQAQ
jgi:hypothetical protein